MLIPRNYTEGLEKLDLLFCTNYCVKEIVASHSLGNSTSLGTKERISYTDRNHRSILEQHSELTFGKKGSE